MKEQWVMLQSRLGSSCHSLKASSLSSRFWSLGSYWKNGMTIITGDGEWFMVTGLQNNSHIYGSRGVFTYAYFQEELNYWCKAFCQIHTLEFLCVQLDHFLWDHWEYTQNTNIFRPFVAYLLLPMTKIYFYDSIILPCICLPHFLCLLNRLGPNKWLHILAFVNRTAIVMRMDERNSIQASEKMANKNKTVIWSSYFISCILLQIF